MVKDSVTKVFFALLRSGLWEQELCLLPYGPVDFDTVYELASDQTVVGLVAAGIEHITDTKVPKLQARPFLIDSIRSEQRNASMNEFIVWLFTRLDEEGITAVLVKGQGIAQCYARPEWRAAGDIDLLLDEENYHKAQTVLTKIAASVDAEDSSRLHQAMKMGGFDIELHGTLRTDVSAGMNRGVDAVQAEMFTGRRFRVWSNDSISVLLPCPDDDVIFIFTHILGHFFIGGIGLRQICDLCRLLWTYRDSIDASLLESRLRNMGLMSEWKAFAALAVDYLGIPVEVMPLYSPAKKWSRKATRIVSYIFDTGNFGHNRDMSGFSHYPAVVRRLARVWMHFKDNVRLCTVFPVDVPKFFCHYLVSKTAKTF